MAGKCKVYKKTSSNNSLTVYLTHRDFLEDRGRQVVPVAGVVQFTEEQLRGERIFCLVNMTYRYGRQADEAMAHTFERTIQLLNAPINVSSDGNPAQYTVDDNHIEGEVCGEGKLAKILHYDEEKETEMNVFTLPERTQRVIDGTENKNSDKFLNASQNKSNKENLNQSKCGEEDRVVSSKQNVENSNHGEETSETRASSEKKETRAYENRDAEKNIEQGKADEAAPDSNEAIKEKVQNDLQAQEPSIAKSKDEQVETEMQSKPEYGMEDPPRTDKQQVDGHHQVEADKHCKNQSTGAEIPTEARSVSEEDTKNDEKSSEEDSKSAEETSKDADGGPVGVSNENGGPKTKCESDSNETKQCTSEKNDSGSDLPPKGESNLEEEKLTGNKSEDESETSSDKSKSADDTVANKDEEKDVTKTADEINNGSPHSKSPRNSVEPETQRNDDQDPHHIEAAAENVNNLTETKQETTAHNLQKVDKVKNEGTLDSTKSTAPEKDISAEEPLPVTETANSFVKDGVDDKSELETSEKSPEGNRTTKDLQESCETPIDNTSGERESSEIEGPKKSGKPSSTRGELDVQNATKAPNSTPNTMQRPKQDSRSLTLKNEKCESGGIINTDRVESVTPDHDSTCKSSVKAEHDNDEARSARSDAKEMNEAVDKTSDAFDQKSEHEDVNEGFTRLAEHRSRVIDSHPLHDKILQSRRHYLLPVPSQQQLEALTPHRHCPKREINEQVKTADENPTDPPVGSDADGGNTTSNAKPNNDVTEQNSEGAQGTTDDAKPKSDETKPARKRGVSGVCHDVGVLQNRLIEKLQMQQENERCVPFSVSVPAVAPNSVTLVPGPQQSVSEPVGVIYELRVYAAKKITEEPARYKSASFAVRKLQLSPDTPVTKSDSNLVSHKNFECSPGEINLSVALNKEIYSHLEEIETTVSLHNKSKKTVKSIVCEVVQQVSIGMTSTKFSRVVTTLESRDGCPVLPNYKIERKFCLMPDVRYNKANVGVAILGQLKDADSQLASTTLSLTENSLDEDLGIVVTYFVRVSLTFGSLSGVLSIEHPMQLLHARPEEYGSDENTSNVLQKLKGINDPSKICIEEFALLRKLKSLDLANDP